MTDEDFQKYLEDRYYNQINWYDAKSIYNQKWYKRNEWGIIVLAAITPILIVIEGLTDRVPWLIWVPAATATLVAIFSAALKTFKLQENWINYRTICETLRKEIHYYNAGIGEYEHTDNKKKMFVQRVEAIISKENTLWLEYTDIKQEENSNQ